MEYREVKPSILLSDVVERYWSIESDRSGEASPEPVLPDGCPEIIFNLADRFQRIPTFGEIETQSSTIVSGQLRKRIMIRPTGRVSLFGVRSRPHSGFGLLRVGMSSLTDHVGPLSDVIGVSASEIEEKVRGSKSFEDRVAIVEQILLNTYATANGDSGIAADLADLITSNGGRMSVRELVGHSGVGERRIERIFAKHVGVSPKMFARIVRFSGVVRSIEAADSFGMLDAALSFGYYDQSHMIHEFNEFAGTSPLGYFEATHRLSELFTS